MNNLYLKLFTKFQNLINEEEGQDLVEYALLVALVSLAAVAGLTSLGTTINSVFTSINGTLSAAV